MNFSSTKYCRLWVCVQNWIYISIPLDSRPLTQQTLTPQYWLSRSAKTPRIDWQYVILISTVLVVHNRRQRFCWAVPPFFWRSRSRTLCGLHYCNMELLKRLFMSFWKDIHEAKVVKDQMFLRRQNSPFGGSLCRREGGAGCEASASLWRISRVIHHHL